MIKKIARYRRPVIAFIDLGLIVLALIAAFLLRFDFAIPASEARHLIIAFAIALPLKSLVFQFAGMHRGLWRFASFAELGRVFGANVLASTSFVLVTLALADHAFPRSIYVLDFLLCFLFTSASRFALRLYREILMARLPRGGCKGVLIYGAGAAGITLIREIRANPKLRYEALGFLDDDPRKLNASITGLKVLGTGRDAARIVSRFQNRLPRVDEIIIAMPSATARQMLEAVANCRSAGVRFRTVPGLTDLLSGKVLSNQIRNVSLADLLSRDAVHLEEDRIREKLSGRCALVTGGAGSIGSELCRQLTEFGVERLVILDQAESDLYRIELEIRQNFPKKSIVVEIGDIRDYARICDVMERNSVDVVFHAAAYKHVPMMEAHVLEAMRNNVLGTWNVVRAAERCGVSRFVLISSDKAVNPTSIMGATKRVAELILTSMSNRSSPSATKFMAVRFGNVLGSNGSVVPLFQAQIAQGGPITITHPDVRRYFMTIREAVQLILQASTMGNASEVFVLDMGQPVRIMDLARQMVRLCGLEPGEDIDFRITGLRPGEKLFEELITEGDDIVPTYHSKIKICKANSASREDMEAWIEKLVELLHKREAAPVVAHLSALVPEYLPPRTATKPKRLGQELLLEAVNSTRLGLVEVSAHGK
jgi:FlaA1/EpsC-like NDP-sugar epimerase